ncbi:DUF1684 domain-containing protein [Rufibacter sediminis]|uniref:DUF1684 domain-containing protein n=1 Tax=Rufibacter sediminis TaxID=2762756 RepID=A0ABR6VXG6_9BACT|nr:DUF1684 domain-containing protein [Rufibacter sediminis]MBC3541828.1 DUF1684 domain-containing protein [Rufibacter sediminis]
MKKLLVLLLLAMPFLAQAQKTSSGAYLQEIARHRAHEDSVFKFDEHSPLKAEAKATFKGLEYFPVNEAYRVKAKFVRNTQESVFIMPTTGTRNPEYVKYGELHFNLQGQPLQLSVYQNQELKKQPKYMTYLFIPFTDATTGQETYATGRYLDFSIPMNTDSVWLDFNKAYNPYCAYGDGYSCPIPPKENKLPVRVEAGVKNYDKEGNPAEDGLAKPIEILPEFPGGQQAMMDFMMKHFRVSKAVWKTRINGNEIISFLVEKDGAVSNVESVSTLHPDLFAEIVRVIGKMPKWKPGSQNGIPVPVKYTIPLKITTRK